MANPINFKDKTCYFVVTGASRGIGQRMAIETSKNFKNGSVIVLLARSEKDLLTTKAEILKNNENLVVKVVAWDLCKQDPKDYEKLFSETYNGNFDMAVIIHNVGTVGDVSKKAKDHETYEELEKYYSINVISPIVLNNHFMKVVPQDVKKLIINVSSKASEVPFASFSLYCSAKASRKMFFKVLAEEEKSNNTVVLSYCPGPVETEMTNYVLSSSCDDGVVSYFKGLHDTKTILTTEQTTKRFLEILETGNFESGDQVDFYDEI